MILLKMGNILYMHFVAEMTTQTTMKVKQAILQMSNKILIKNWA